MADKRKDQPGNGGNMGEGNRKADRQYRDDVKRDANPGRPEQAGQEAQRNPDDDRLRREMEEAERIGRSRGGEHDPEVKKH
jgi:hypothetical protein